MSIDDTLRALLQHKVANMDAQTAGQVSGAAPPGAAPPGAPAPVDPTAMDPMAGMQPQGPPPSVDDMAAMGDPIGTYLVELRQKFDMMSAKQDLLIEAVGRLMDQQGIQTPASQALVDGINAAAAKQVTASTTKKALGPLLDTETPDDSLVVDPAPVTDADQESILKESLRFGSAKQSEFRLGKPGRPGDNGVRLETHMATVDQDRRHALQAIWASRR